ncbi:hypothetical protein U1872_18270 [Sphingomonas sp. RB3P16]|uniref:glycosyltransferase n=1 Tax=Parasphingomonas frigoris TaxID=3096163 RepID=UPI002FCC1394
MANGGLMDLGRGPLVLLFYDGFEKQADCGAYGKIRSNIRGRLRSIYRRMQGKQVNTGFYVAFLSLVDSLKKVGCDVRINDFSLALKFPRYPIGISGYPSVITKTALLPNPMLFGPGDPGFPDEVASIRETANVRLMIQPSDWYVDFYRRYCGDIVVRWPAGIDTSVIPDTLLCEKSVDVAIYDKVRWNRAEVVPRVVDRLKTHLDGLGLSHVTLRYGAHTQPEYFDVLRRSRSLAFLCEHETQGLACEEAMAMNVPILAWDEGFLADPRQRPLAAPDLRVSSVPYFDDRCGIQFRETTMEESFNRFWRERQKFRPREYVEEHLNMRMLAGEYIRLLERVGS